jgi:hypothetical protein
MRFLLYNNLCVATIIISCLFVIAALFGCYRQVIRSL